MKDLVAESRGAIQKGSKTFSFAARFFDPERARDAALLYHWCRACDDAIDEAVGSPAEAVAKIRTELNEKCGPARGLVLLTQKYDIPAHYPLELIEGLASDADFRPPETWRDLELYCYRVAGVVGLMMAHVMGVSSEAALKAACDLGMAMQLTNIARDVTADAKMGRCYLPREILTQHGLTFENYLDHRQQLARVVSELLERADSYYVSGQSGTRFLSRRSSFVILLARFAYARIGARVRARGARAWDQRQITTPLEKAAAFVRASGVWLKELFHRPPWVPVRISQTRRFS